MKRLFSILPLITLLILLHIPVFSAPADHTDRFSLEIVVTPDTSICPGNSLLLTANVTPASESVTFLWDHGLGDGRKKKVLPNETTIYTVKATDEQGNSGTAQIKVTLFEQPAPAITGEQLICPGVNAKLDAGDFVAYKWSTGEKTRTAEITDDGDISVRVQDNNGCWGEAIVKIKEREFKYPKITGELGFCQGLSTTLDAGEFASYRWNTGETSRTITVGDDGIYQVTVEDEHGCVSHAREEILEYEAATPTIRGDTFFCPGSTTRLNARGHFDFYAWSTGETDPVIEVGEAGLYRINVESEDGCLGQNEITITQREAPKPVILGPSQLCAGNIAALKTGPFAAYVWSTADTTQMIEVNQAGTYEVTVTDAYGCQGKTTWKVAPLPPKLQDFGLSNNVEIRSGEVVRLSAGKAARYRWEPAVSLSCSDCRYPKASPLQTTTYRVTAWDKNECSVQDSLIVKVLEK